MKIKLLELQEIKKNSLHTLNQVKVNTEKDNGQFYQTITKQLHSTAEKLSSLADKTMPSEGFFVSRFSRVIGQSPSVVADDKLVECSADIGNLNNQLSNLKALHNNLLELIKIKEDIANTQAQFDLQPHSIEKKQLYDTANTTINAINMILNATLEDIDNYRGNGQMEKLESIINDNYSAFTVQAKAYRAGIRSEAVESIFSYSQQTKIEKEKIGEPSKELRETAIDPERERQKTQTLFFFENDQPNENPSISYE
ncbi:hypothetical protein L3V83_07895 [Thiotrichales bacterium 19X7-9]|nr:hypothetical protein [Thiotrichales bacterium 19X7-9]